MTHFSDVDFSLNTNPQKAAWNSCRESHFSRWRSQGMQRNLSLCFPTFSSSYRSITNLPAWTNVIFLPCSYQMPLPPCVSTTLLPEINAGPTEAGTKTVITHKATNSLAITAYFIHYCKEEKCTHIHAHTLQKVARDNHAELIYLSKPQKSVWELGLGVERKLIFMLTSCKSKMNLWYMLLLCTKTLSVHLIMNLANLGFSSSYLHHPYDGGKKSILNHNWKRWIIFHHEK